MGYLRDETDKLIESFGKMRDAYNGKFGNFQIIENILSDTETDVNILSELYGFKEIQGSLSGKCTEERLEEMKSSFEKLWEKFEKMETKLGKP